MPRGRKVLDGHNNLQLDGETSAAGVDERSILLVSADDAVVAHLPHPSRSRVVRNPVRQCSSNAGMLQQCSEMEPGGWKDKIARAMLCCLAMILCPAAVGLFGGMLLPTARMPNETIEVVDTSTHVGECSLLISERELQGCKRKTPWLEPHEEGVVVV
jgi:hypothetical protein